MFPNVDVGVMFQRNERRHNQADDIKKILGPSLSMTLPIFDQNQARIAKAQYLYWQETKRYEAEYLQAIQEIRIAVDQAQTALANAAYYRQEMVPQAERNLEFSRSSYLAGQTSILTLLEAQRFLLESRRGDIAVRLELATAISELEQRVGEQMGNDPAAAGVPPSRRTTCRRPRRSRNDDMLAMRYMSWPPYRRTPGDTQETAQET